MVKVYINKMVFKV